MGRGEGGIEDRLARHELWTPRPPAAAPLPLKEGGYEVVYLRLADSRPGRPQVRMTAFDPSNRETDGPGEVIARSGPAGVREAIIQLCPEIYAFMMRDLAS
jgi:hypothetical protein